jgi:hypothetical protein
VLHIPFYSYSFGFTSGSDIRWTKAFKRRAIYSLVVLATITYLQLVTRLLQGLRCIPNAQGQSVLQIELTTECYTGAHLGTSIFIWPVLIAYGFAFPAWCFYITRRSATKGMDDLKRAEKYGFLYRNVHKRFYYFRLFTFFTNFALAMQTALCTYRCELCGCGCGCAAVRTSFSNFPVLLRCLCTASPVAVSIFVSTTFLVINVLLVGTFWPFKTKLDNFSWFASVGLTCRLLVTSLSLNSKCFYLCVCT